jgi:hypothetical protein
VRHSADIAQDQPARRGCFPVSFRIWFPLVTPSIDGVLVGVSVNVMNAKRRFLEHLSPSVFSGLTCAATQTPAPKCG